MFVIYNFTILMLLLNAFFLIYRAQSIFRAGLETTQLRLEVERRDAEEGSPDISPDITTVPSPSAGKKPAFVFAKPTGPPPPR